MWKKLARLTDDLAGPLQQHMEICSRDTMDIAAIVQVRWRMAGLSRQRLDYLNITILPAVERTATGEFARHLQALKDSTPHYRQAISNFVATWPTEAVQRDWIGYRTQSLAIFAIIRQRLADESALMQLAARHDSQPHDAREAVASLKVDLWR